MEIKEAKIGSDHKLKADCVVMYQGKRVTDGVTWVDGEGKSLSDNSHLEVQLKSGSNNMKCKYEAGPWKGSRSIMKFLQIGGGTDSSSSGTLHGT